MHLFKAFATGVLVWFATGSVVTAHDLEPLPLSKPWHSRSWYISPTDFCIYDGRNICTIPSGGKRSVLEPPIEPIRGIQKKTEPLPAGRYPNKPAFFGLCAMAYASAWIDMHHTYSYSAKKDWIERNPLVRPLLKLPAPAYYAVGFGLVTGMNYLGWKMARSKRFQRMWFLPQVLAISGNAVGRLTSQ